MMSPFFRKLLASTTLALLASSCGAPTKSAGDVGSLFNGSGESLGSRMSSVCADLRSRSESPSLTDIKLSDDDCLAAGRAGQDYKSLTKFQFANVNTESIAGSKGEKSVRINTRGQVWLNKSLIGLAGAFGKSLAKAGGSAGSVAVPGSTFGGDLVKPTIDVTEKIVFDQAAREFSGAVNFKLSGAITVDNEIKIGGKIFDDAVVARIDSTTDRDFKDSLLKSIKALVVIIPFAGDVYVDFILDIEVHSIGTDAVIAGALQEALSGGMKTMLDGMLTL